MLSLWKTKKKHETLFLLEATYSFWIMVHGKYGGPLHHMGIAKAVDPRRRGKHNSVVKKNLFGVQKVKHSCLWPSWGVKA